jgi:hypothetical protein
MLTLPVLVHFSGRLDRRRNLLFRCVNEIRHDMGVGSSCTFGGKWASEGNLYPPSSLGATLREALNPNATWGCIGPCGILLPF